MAKKLNTTVHLTDERGNTHCFGPDDELPGWASDQLNEAWGDRDDLWEEAVPAEELSVKDALEQRGTPPPDRGPVEQEEPEGRDAEAVELGQEVRTEQAEQAGAANDADPVDAEDDEADKPRGRGRK